MRAWYIPSWTGDFRLEALPDIVGRCVLTVEDPTAVEEKVLARFRETCKGNGWWPNRQVIHPKGRSEIRIEAPLREAGVILAGLSSPPQGTLTAVRCVDGTVSVDLNPAGALEQVEAKKIEAIAEAPEKEKAEVEKAKKPDKAATVKRPTPCCPENTEGPDVRSSTVLQAFCTAEQWVDWGERRALVCVGNRTGHAYLLMHRHSTRGIENGKIGYDLDTGRTMHFHDRTVPPAEEVLAAKLILENREEWLCINATMSGNEMQFENTLGPGFEDGVADAALCRRVGYGMQSFVRNLLGGYRAGQRMAGGA